MITLNRGVLIAVEGIDGSGKSSLVKNLSALLEKAGLPVRTTREPGATPLGKQLRTLVQEKSVAICPEAEFLLFAADRAQHMHEIVLPALAQNKIVISDRMKDSSLVYQGYGRGLDRTFINTVNSWTMQNREPDLTLYVNVDIQTASERIKKRNEKLTSFEKEHAQFIQKLIDGFNDLYYTPYRSSMGATHTPSRSSMGAPDLSRTQSAEARHASSVIILDGNLDEQTVAHTAYKELTTWMQQQSVINN